MDYLSNFFSEEDKKEIDKEIALFNQEYDVGVLGCIRENIFDLLEEVGTLIFYPFKKQELWGVYFYKNEKNYFIINSSIHLEKQIFAAAHELAHSLDIARVNYEIVTVKLLTGYFNNNENAKQLEKAERMANRFAAELLMGKKKIIEKYNELPKVYSLISKIVLLSDIFLVPYKSVVKRFVEVGLITEYDEFKKLLEVSDEEIKQTADRHECCRRNFEISNEEKLGGYANKALLAYENDLMTFNELKEKLKLIKRNPDDFSVQDIEIDEYEFLVRASESSEVEDEDDKD